MLVLADTNILLRLVNPADSGYAVLRGALDSLLARGDRLCFVSQNIVEFWNVCTRPADRNGLGLSGTETDARAKLIESQFLFLPDNERTQIEWRQLVIRYGVAGVQVHDARIVAAMKVYRVSHLLTLDDRHFARYAEIISVIHPRNLVPATSQ